MAVLTVQNLSRDGLVATLAAAASGGDSFVNDGHTLLRVKNAHATNPRTVTVNSRVNCNQGFDHNVAVVVAALTTADIGPFPVTRFNNPATNAGNADVTYSDSAADLTVAAISLPTS